MVGGRGDYRRTRFGEHCGGHRRSPQASYTARTEAVDRATAVSVYWLRCGVGDVQGWRWSVRPSRSHATLPSMRTVRRRVATRGVTCSRRAPCWVALRCSAAGGLGTTRARAASGSGASDASVAIVGAGLAGSPPPTSCTSSASARRSSRRAGGSAAAAGRRGASPTARWPSTRRVHRLPPRAYPPARAPARPRARRPVVGALRLVLPAMGGRRPRATRRPEGGDGHHQQTPLRPRPSGSACCGPTAR